jgi:D-alanine-D-alanine ligase
MLSTDFSEARETMAKVLLLYNEPVLPDNHPDAESERDLLHTVDAVHLILKQHDHQVTLCGLRQSPEELLEPIRQHQPEVVFNLFEGFGGNPASEYHIAGLLEWLHIPYTGCPLEAMVLGRDKVRTKYLLQGAGLPTASFQAVQQISELKLPSPLPVFVKPASTDASIGIDQQSVVQNEVELRSKVNQLLADYGPPILVESYLPGTEFNVGVVELPEKTCLPVAEMVYTPQEGVAWPIVSYASKWESGSAEDLAMQPRCPALIPEALSKRLQQIAVDAFTLLGCRDVARVDLRLDAKGQPHILEVNPNPDLGPSAGLARMVRTSGLSYEAFIHRLVLNRLGS